MKRRVKGTIKRLQVIPWGGATVSFAMKEGSYDLEAFYPGDTISVITDEKGEFSVELWCNEAGLSPAYYNCTINGKESFFFTLPVGDTEIDLSELRKLGAKPFPTAIAPKLRDIRQVFSPDSGQMQFTLSKVPIHPHLASVWLNGVKQFYPKDYIIDSALLVYSGNPRLESTDYLEIVYYVEF